MNRRNFLTCAGVMSLALCGAIQANAQTEGVVSSTDILKALTAPQSKDVRLDSSGRPLPPRDPAIDLQVQFKLNSAELLPLGRLQLDQLALAFQNKALVEAGFELAGHTDRSGTREHNLKLSRARAESVRTYLMQQHGVIGRRLIAAGYGYDRLADPAHPNAAVNRRVEVRRIMVVQPDALPGSTPPGGVAPNREPGGRIVPAPRQ